MPKVTVELAITVEGKDSRSTAFEQVVDHEPRPDGIAYFLAEGQTNLKADLLYADYIDELPSVENLAPEPKGRTYKLNDLLTDQVNIDTNKQELWRFVSNTAFAIRFALAKAHALHQLQTSIDPDDERMRILLHLDKMEKLHVAVHAIALLRDLHKGIVGESLGGIEFSVKKPHGRVRLRSLREVLKHRRKFKELNGLGNHQIAELERIAAEIDAPKTFIKYRNTLVHGTPQVVDDPIFYPQFDDGKWEPIKKKGKIVGKQRGVFVRRTKPDWFFDDLFKMVVTAFEKYLGTLHSLRSLEAFKP